MVKRQAWIGRDPSGEMRPEKIDEIIRRKTEDLPEGLPSPGWKREDKRGITLSSEQFPGSYPVWIWEE